MGSKRDIRSGEAMMVFDADLRVLDWNQAAEALTGLPAAEVIGRHCWEALGATDEHNSLVCHSGCSYARLAQDGWPVPTRQLSVKSKHGRKLVTVATVSVRNTEPPVFLHLLRNGAESDRNGSEQPVAKQLPLTRRQHEILVLLGEGVPAKVIGAELGLTEATTRNHIRAILARLDCHSQLEAVAKARRLHIL